MFKLTSDNNLCLKSISHFHILPTLKWLLVLILLIYKPLKLDNMIFPTAPKRLIWLLHSQPKKRTAVHTRQGPSPPGRKQTQKCRGKHHFLAHIQLFNAHFSSRFKSYHFYIFFLYFARSFFSFSESSVQPVCQCSLEGLADFSCRDAAVAQSSRQAICSRL